MSISCRTLLAALAALLLLPTTGALADRAPTKQERAGIAKKAGVPARCLKTRVSTVNGRWASTHVRNARTSCRRWAADGIAVFKRRKAGGWRFVTAGSAFECPVPKVPPRVVDDLGIRCEDLET